MSIVRVFVGLDYHQDSIQVCVMSPERKVLVNRSVPNEVPLVLALVERYGQQVEAAVEACCGSANLAEQLTKHGWRVHLAHPGFTTRMKQNPDKTDLQDAQLLADLLSVGYLPHVWLAPESLRELRHLTRHRQHLVDLRRNIKLKLRALLREHRIKAPKETRAWSIAWLAWLKGCELPQVGRWLADEHLEELQRLSNKIKEVEQKLEALVKDHPVYLKLRAEPGVGLVTAVTMLAEIGDFSRFQNGKQLAKYCGVTPRNASSGQRQADAGLVRAGNPQVRRVLIELAHRLVRMPGRWSEMCQHLSRSGKQKNIVIAAVANRWVRWLHHRMLTPEPLSV